MTLVIGVISVVVALAIPSVLMVLNSSYTLFTAGVFSPVVAGLLWKKATKIGAFAGLFSGLAFVALGWSGFSFLRYSQRYRQLLVVPCGSDYCFFHYL